MNKDKDDKGDTFIGLIGIIFLITWATFIWMLTTNHTENNLDLLDAIIEQVQK